MGITDIVTSLTLHGGRDKLKAAFDDKAFLEANAVERFSDAVLFQEHLPVSVFQSLSVVALRQLVSTAGSAVGLGTTVDSIVDSLTKWFGDPSQRLTKALQTANDKAWKALEIALGGESLWDRCKGALAAAEDRALGEQIRAFLDASPLTKWSNKSPEHVELFRRALHELRTARSRGWLRGDRIAPGEMAQEVSAFARFAGPQDLIDAEWKIIDRTANELKACPGLCKILVSRVGVSSGRSASILAVAVRYYFRQVVASDPELSRDLTFAKLEAIKESQDEGFRGLTAALTQQGQRLEGLLGDVLQVVGRIDTTTTDTNIMVRGLVEQVQQLVERSQLQNREVRPSDSLSIRNEGERQLVKKLVAEYRALPEEQRRNPSLLNNVGKLEIVAGDFEAAQRDFQAVATMTPEPRAQAEAHYNAYQAALERCAWSEALLELKQASRLDPSRFALPDGEIRARTHPRCRRVRSRLPVSQHALDWPGCDQDLAKRRSGP